MGWLPAGDGYEVALIDRKVVCRKTGGRPLKSVPKAVREHEVTESLGQAQEWLDNHATECRETVERWLIRSLPVPTAVLAAVWPDPAWRGPLTDVIVAPVDADGTWRLDDAGFLREASAESGLGVINLDGESVRLTTDRVALPHPVLLEDLEDLREFATDLGIDQGTPQLFREVWQRPETTEERAAAVRRYAGGEFKQLSHLTARAAKLGFQVRGGSALCQVWEGGTQTQARVWVGDDDPYSSAETGPLSFTTAAGTEAPLDRIGPVAWSEGMRMAATLYAGRVVKENAA